MSEERQIQDIRWSFYGYITMAGTKEVLEWFRSLEQSEYDEAEDVILYLSRLPLEAWGEPPFKGLGDGLSEIRFKASKTKRIFRVYGYFGPVGRRYSYTMLLGDNKKVRNPSDDIQKARNRMKDVEKKRCFIHELQF